MGMRLRMGPLSVSSRGRVGVSAGPLSIYGGGRRRRSSNGDSGGAVFVGLAIVFALAYIAVKWSLQHWYVVAPILLVLAVVGFYAFQAHEQAEAARRIREADERHREEAARVAARKAWAAGPPPAFVPPSRFTENWLATNVPSMHPGQLTFLKAAMRSREWDDGKIAARLAPYLAANDLIRS